MNPTDLSEELNALRLSLGRFDVLDTVATVAALQLLPENADRSFRLGVLSCLAANMPGGGDEKISRSNLAAILRSTSLSQLAPMEDQAEGLFAEDIAGPEGGYLMVCGPLQGTVPELRALCNAILGTDSLQNEFQYDASRLLVLFLRLGNRACKLARIRRGSQPVTTSHKKIVIPPSEILSALKRAVTPIWRYCVSPGRRLQ